MKNPDWETSKYSRGWLVVVLVLVFGVAACEKRQARELPFPEIDTRAVFAELGGASEGDKAGVGSSSAFERSISEALEGANPAEQPAAVMLQTIALGAGLVGDIPVKFDEWRWASDGKVTLISHGMVGQSPDVLMYIEPFGGLMATSPTREMIRFQQNVGVSNLFSSVLSLMDAAGSATLGQGIGYRPSAHSFSGWRWVGRNDGDVTLRLGRNAGVWGAQTLALPGLIGMLEQFAAMSPEIAQLQAHLVGLREESAGEGRAANRVAARSATMVLGSASKGATTGIHLAILCQGSRCGLASELAHFLASIRVAGQESGFDAAEMSLPTDSFGELSESVGIAFVPEELRISPGRFSEILRGQQGGGVPAIPGLDLSF